MQEIVVENQTISCYNKNMKTLLLTVALAAFALAAQAGDSACSGHSCCGQTMTSEQTKVTCPMAKQASTQTCCKASKMRQLTVSKVLKSPKAQSS
jgi:hypothetical protein